MTSRDKEGARYGARAAFESSKDVRCQECKGRPHVLHGKVGITHHRTCSRAVRLREKFPKLYA